MLTCGCGWDGDYEQYYEIADEFTPFKGTRRKRCTSCNKLINIGESTLKAFLLGYAGDAIEEKIYEDNPILRRTFTYCEECGEILLNLNEYGYCFDLKENMHALLAEHWGNTGYKPPEA